MNEELKKKVDEEIESIKDDLDRPFGSKAEKSEKGWIW